MVNPDKVFTLEGKALKLDTAEDLDAHIAALKAMDDVEEVRILGNTLGIGACKRLGEVLSTKNNLQVGRPRTCLYHYDVSTSHQVRPGTNILRLPTLPTSSRVASSTRSPKRSLTCSHKSPTFLTSPLST